MIETAVMVIASPILALMGAHPSEPFAARLQASEVALRSNVSAVLGGELPMITAVLLGRITAVSPPLHPPLSRPSRWSDNGLSRPGSVPAWLGEGRSATYRRR